MVFTLKTLCDGPSYPNVRYRRIIETIRLSNQNDWERSSEWIPTAASKMVARYEIPGDRNFE